MTPGDPLFVIFVIVIVSLSFMVCIMGIRIHKLTRRVHSRAGRVNGSDSDLDILTRNLEDLKNLKI